MKQYSSVKTFSELPLLPGLVEALRVNGYDTPMPVQSKGLAPLLAGESAIVRAKTGTGKTALFGLPILQAIQSGEMRRALVLAPTRELAHQISEEIGRLSQFCDKVVVASLVGGRAISRQQGKLAAANVLIMTPGRALDALENNRVDSREFGAIVVDEADHMLEVGSLEVCARILELVVRKPTQLVFCSATFSDEIRKLCNKFRREMVDITLSVKTGDHGTVFEWAINTFPERHLELTREIINQRQPSSCIVFCNHRARVSEVAAGLEQLGLPAVPLHGDLNQKERTTFMQQFREGEFSILVATNLAARGIDIPGLELVINYDLPYDVTDYVHRYGRTGRAGKGGMVVSFYNGKAVRRIQDIEKRTGREMKRNSFADVMAGRGADGQSGGPKTPPLTLENTTRLIINCGRKGGMTFGALKSMLSKDCQINVKKDVAFIDLQDEVTLIGVYAKKAQSVAITLGSRTIKDRPLKVEFRDGERAAVKSAAASTSTSTSQPRIGKTRVNRKPPATKKPRTRRKSTRTDSTAGRSDRTKGHGRGRDGDSKTSEKPRPPGRSGRKRKRR